ncbi:hypothetical protein CYMTET_35943, partial [Cymbomonas tetramitiformis]
MTRQHEALSRQVLREGRRAPKGAPHQAKYGGRSKEEYLALLTSQVDRDTQLLEQERQMVANMQQQGRVAHGSVPTGNAAHIIVNPNEVPGLRGAFRREPQRSVAQTPRTKPSKHQPKPAGAGSRQGGAQEPPKGREKNLVYPFPAEGGGSPVARILPGGVRGGFVPPSPGGGGFRGEVSPGPFGGVSPGPYGGASPGPFAGVSPGPFGGVSPGPFGEPVQIAASPGARGALQSQQYGQPSPGMAYPTPYHDMSRPPPPDVQQVEYPPCPCICP